MEHVLLKLARQLNAFDEASLMNLWEKYAAQVQSFEPTKRWEEAALVFGFIQALRMKNQLFNYHWAESARPKARPSLLDPNDPLSHGLEGLGVSMQGTGGEKKGSGETGAEKSAGGQGRGSGGKQRAKVLRFRTPEGDDSV